MKGCSVFAMFCLWESAFSVEYRQGCQKPTYINPADSTCAGDLQSRLRQLVNQQPIMLFMKVGLLPSPCLALSRCRAFLVAWAHPRSPTCLPAASPALALATLLPERAARLLGCMCASFAPDAAHPPACIAAHTARGLLHECRAWVMRKAQSPRPRPRANTCWVPQEESTAEIVILALTCAPRGQPTLPAPTLQAPPPCTCCPLLMLQVRRSSLLHACLVHACPAVASRQKPSVPQRLARGAPPAGVSRGAPLRLLAQGG